MDKPPDVIGVTGSSGSGKTFFLNCFLNHFSTHEVSLISQDNYYIPAHTKTKEENKHYNFDLPTAFHREAFFSDVKSLAEGHTIYKTEYVFNNPNLTPRVLEIKPAPILIIEGLFIFYYEEINALLDFRIFMHADDEIALQRRLRRDLIERGYSDEDVRYKWVNHVLPAYHQFLLPFQAHCDRIVVNNTDDPTPIMEVTNEISTDLRKKVLSGYER